VSRFRTIPAALLFGAAVLVAVGANAFVAPEIEKRRVATNLEEELAFYPSGELIRQVTGGFPNLVADLLWLRAIQYYGEHRKTDLVFDRAAHVFEVLTDLDPHFIEAFRFGALVVVEDAGDPERGMELLRKGIRANPDCWELFFDLGFHYFRRGDHDAAATYFRRASLIEGAPPRVARFAAAAEKRRGGLEMAERLWEEILRTTENEMFQEAAVFALKGIAAARDTTLLAAQGRLFHERHGRYPRDPAEMIEAGLLDQIPIEPYGARYLIHPENGEVRSAFLLDREVRRDLYILQSGVDAFRTELGRLPGSLEEVVEVGLIDEIPSPWGVRYRLSDEKGAVEAFVGSRPAPLMLTPGDGAS